MKIKQSKGDHIFGIIVNAILILCVLICLYPLYLVVINSFSDPSEVAMGNVYIIPKGFSLDAYKKVFEDSEIMRGYANALYQTLMGTALNMLLTVPCAYALSKKRLFGGSFVMKLFVFTMYFSGGLIPNYLLIKDLGLLNTRWAMIIPGAVSVYNCLILRNYFMNSIPLELKEAATLDGASSAAYLWKIVLPLSKAVLAVVALYYMVAHWNNYTRALYYIFDKDLYPLQSILKDLLISDKMVAELMTDPEIAEEAFNRSQMMKYCVLIAAVTPMMCVYPFVQKYFVKGVMVGAVKG